MSEIPQDEPKSERRPHQYSLWAILLVTLGFAILCSVICGVARFLWLREQAREQSWRCRCIRRDIAGLPQALETYKTEMGDYPPSDSSNLAEINRHLRRAFPRCTTSLTSAPFAGPNEALHFWLAGPDGNGFCANPRAPFQASEDTNSNGQLDSGEDTNGNGKLDGCARIGPFYEFDEGRLNGHVYKPFKESTDPYLYFKSTSYGTTCTVPSGTVVTAIQVDSTGKYANPRSFQIHCPGLDGKFGSGGNLNDSTGYTEERWDDTGNFDFLPSRPEVIRSSHTTAHRRGRI